MTFQPYSDQVLVKALTPDDKTAGGLFLPQSARAEIEEAEVVAFGPGRILQSGELAALPLKVRDRVVYSAGQGTKVKVDGVEHVLIRFDYLLGCIG